MGISSLKGRIANDIWQLGQSRKLPQNLWRRARFLLALMNASSRLDNLRLKGSPPDIRLHKLKGNLKDYWSITIDRSSGWRVIFKFEGGEFIDVEIIDYH